MVISLELKTMSSLKQYNNICAHKRVTEPGAPQSQFLWGTERQQPSAFSVKAVLCADLSCTSVNTSNTFCEFPVRSFEPWGSGRDCIRLKCWWLPLVVMDWKAHRMNECKINIFWKDEFPWLRKQKHFWLWKWLFQFWISFWIALYLKDRRDGLFIIPATSERHRETQRHLQTRGG